MTEITEKPKRRKSWTARFKRDVKKFHVETGMEYTVIGIKAIKNPRFYDRLVKGGTITLASADRVYDWMEEQGYHFNRNQEEIDNAGEGNIRSDESLNGLDQRTDSNA